MCKYLHEPPAVRMRVSGALLRQCAGDRPSHASPESVSSRAPALRRRRRRQVQPAQPTGLVEVVPAGTPLRSGRLRVGVEQHRPP